MYSTVRKAIVKKRQRIRKLVVFFAMYIVVKICMRILSIYKALVFSSGLLAKNQCGQWMRNGIFNCCGLSAYFFTIQTHKRMHLTT